MRTVECRSDGRQTRLPSGASLAFLTSLERREDYGVEGPRRKEEYRACESVKNAAQRRSSCFQLRIDNGGACVHGDKVRGGNQTKVASGMGMQTTIERLPSLLGAG